MPTSTKKVAAVKKVAKKPAVKKVAKATKSSAVKKAVTKSTLKPLVYADNAKAFWVKDGQILNSLLALHTALSSMDKLIYSHHVAKDRHDFAVWVETVLGDQVCADELRKTKTQAGAKVVVAKYLKLYKI